MANPRLDEKRISIHDLMLDPSNPRFVDGFGQEVAVEDSGVEAVQEELLRRFKVGSELEEAADEDEDREGFFAIKELHASMTSIGFVPIDRVVVRELERSSKFLVIEGNRRVSAAKTLLREDAEALPGKELPNEIRETLEEILVLVIDTEGMDRGDIEKEVGVILGLRHFGSVLPWRPLPRAHSIYTQYMSVTDGTDFRVAPKAFRDVAHRLSISAAEVRRAIRTYIAYNQLRDEDGGVLPSHYSLIEAAVTDRRLIGHSYLEVSDGTYELSEPSLQRLNKICQFAARDQLAADKKILADPKAIKPFGRLVADAKGGDPEAIRGFATNLLIDVEDGNRSLEDAVDHLTTFKKARKWVGALEELLDQQEKKLVLGDYSGTGNDLLQKHGLDRVLRNYRILLKI